jgi:hypothetical protein
MPIRVVLGIGMAAVLELGGELIGYARDQRREGVVVILFAVVMVDATFAGI